MKKRVRNTRKVGFQATEEQYSQITLDAADLGFQSVSSLLRTAWRLARKHPELLEEARLEELEDLHSRPLNGSHPMILERKNE